MTRKRALERWGKKIANCEVTPQGIWPIVKFLINRGGTPAPSAIHGTLGPKFLPLEKVNATADCLENQFTPHDFCDENHEWPVEARVKALLEAERIRPCDLQKLINSLKLRKARGLFCIPNECLRHFPRRR
jgi:hypothetical protein